MNNKRKVEKKEENGVKYERYEGDELWRVVT